MAVLRLNDELWFPDPYQGEPDGLVAVGGDLSEERLLLAYSKGFFPYYPFHYTEEPLWYCPLDRFVIFPKEIHISHSMKQLIKQDKYEVTIDQYFQGVIRGCSISHDRSEMDGAWLGPNMVKAYTNLYRKGLAISVEVWDNGWLVGGLYGVSLRHAFFGESMFSLVPNASKLALITLAKRLEQMGAHFIDCQFETPHLASMGARHITYEQYMKILDGGHHG